MFGNRCTTWSIVVGIIHKARGFYFNKWQLTKWPKSWKKMIMKSPRHDAERYMIQSHPILIAKINRNALKINFQFNKLGSLCLGVFSLPIKWLYQCICLWMKFLPFFLLPSNVKLIHWRQMAWICNRKSNGNSNIAAWVKNNRCQTHIHIYTDWVS